MDLDRIIYFFHRSIVYHPFISMGIAAALGILIYIKPKEILRLVLIVLGICAAGYVFHFIWEAFKSGYLNKDIVIHKSIR